MKKRMLGNSDLEVTTLCFGGNVFGWTIDEAQSFKILDAYFEGGGNFIDTADTYSVWVPGHIGGESETIIGKWMKARGNRDQVIVATKVGMQMSPSEKGLKKDYIKMSAERSLKRLQTDYIDLYIAHQEDTSTPIEETLSAYDELIREGKVRAIGASNYSPEGLKAAVECSRKNNLAQYQSLQPLYNLYDRKDFEENLLPICKEYGLAVTPYYALASGFLTGKYRSKEDLQKSQRGGGIEQKYLNDRGLKILEELDRAAKDLNTTPAAVAVAWLIAAPGVTAPIASATSIKQLEDLLRATELEFKPGQYNFS